MNPPCVFARKLPRIPNAPTVELACPPSRRRLAKSPEVVPSTTHPRLAFSGRRCETVLSRSQEAIPSHSIHCFDKEKKKPLSAQVTAAFSHTRFSQNRSVGRFVPNGTTVTAQSVIPSENMTHSLLPRAVPPHDEKHSIRCNSLKTSAAVTAS